MDRHKIKPLANRLLVKRSEAPKSKGGIFLPESAKEKPKEGEVVAAGPGALDEKGDAIPMAICVGDRVLFGAYAGTPVSTSSNEELLILSEDEIFGILMAQ